MVRIHMQAEGAWEQSAKEKMWFKEGRSKRKIKKIKDNEPIYLKIFYNFSNRMRLEGKVALSWLLSDDIKFWSETSGKMKYNIKNGWTSI